MFGLPGAVFGPPLFMQFMVVMKSWRPKAVKMTILGSYSRGDDDAILDRTFRVRARASPGRRVLHALPRPAARQHSAGLGSGPRRGPAVASESPAARARVLA